MKYLFFLQHWLHFLVKIILPYQCVLCLEISDQRRDLCRQCQKELPTPLNTCQQCGVAFSTSNSLIHRRCGQCISHSPNFDHAIVGFDYQTPIDGWLRQFKFHKKGLYARILAEIFLEKLVRVFETDPENRPQALVAMPLHWRRLAQRGFNQAYVIAKYLSRQLGVPIIKTSSVTRIKYTKAQSSLNLDSRKRNVQKAFSVQKLTQIEHVAIVDDIITTGNTVNELSKQLKIAGVHRISVWAIARVN